jgi:flagellar secretion chaperone FliS
MWNNGHDAYLESRVLTADPIELINLLYQACAQAVREARCHLAEGRIADRSRQITKACDIVIELATALDHERGGEISERLALLYDYMLRRLLEANMQQSDAPLADVLGLLSTLSEAWAGVRKPEEKPAAARVWSQPAAESVWSQPTAESVWSQPTAESVWSQPTAESVWSQPTAENVWSQPLAESAWSQPTAARAGSQPAAESVWSQPAAESAWSQPMAESVGSQPAAARVWAQPPAEETDYRLQAYSF